MPGRISEIGIALLLFVIGLELNPGRLWRLRKDIFGVGLLQVVACGLVLSGIPTPVPLPCSCARPGAKLGRVDKPDP